MTSPADAVATPASGPRAKPPESLARRLVPDTIKTLAMRIFGLVSQVLAFVLIARTHTIEAVGIYALVTSGLVIVRMMGPMGLDYAAYRYCSGFIERGDMVSVTGFARFASARVLLTTGAIGGAVLVADIILSQIFPAYEVAETYVALFAIGAPAFAMAGLMSALHRSRGDIVWAQLPDGMFLNILLGVGVLAAWLAGTADARITVAIFVAAAWIVLAASVLRWRTMMGPCIGQLTPHQRAEIGTMAHRVVAGVAVANIAARGPILLVSAVLGPAAAGLYEAGQRFGSLATLTNYAGNAAVAPLMARANARNDLVEKQNLYTIASILQTMPALGILVGLLIVGDELLVGLLGPAYEAAYWVMIMLAVAELIHAALGPAGPFLMMNGQENAITRYSAYSLATSLVLIPVFGWAFGLTGAGAVAIVCALVRETGMALLVARTAGLRLGIVSLTELTRVVGETRRLGPDFMRQAFSRS